MNKAAYQNAFDKASGNVSVRKVIFSKYKYLLNLTLLIFISSYFLTAILYLLFLRPELLDYLNRHG